MPETSVIRSYRELLDYQISHCPDCQQEANPFNHDCPAPLPANIIINPVRPAL